jgi:hypothetical protein
MKAALAAVLESAPIFGGRYSTCTAQYMSLQLCHIPGWLVTSVCMHEVCPVWRIHFPKGKQDGCGPTLLAISTQSSGFEEFFLCARRTLFHNQLPIQSRAGWCHVLDGCGAPHA